MQELVGTACLLNMIKCPSIHEGFASSTLCQCSLRGSRSLPWPTRYRLALCCLSLLLLFVTFSFPLCGAHATFTACSCLYNLTYHLSNVQRELDPGLLNTSKVTVSYWPPVQFIGSYQNIVSYRKIWFKKDPEPCGFVSPEFQSDPSHGDPFQAKFFKILNPD